MWQKLSALRGSTVHAVDGDVGRISDFYFDDERWVVRYAVVETGTWLSKRPVVISVMSLLSPDWQSGRLPASLARDQIRNSPDLGSHPIVSRRLESEFLSYYGFPYYWAGDALWGTVSNPVLAAQQAAIPLQSPQAEDTAATHLHSCRDVVGYHVHARDGEMGHVDDFEIDPAAWAIEALVLETSNGIGGQAVAIAPSSINRIDWAGRAVRVNLSRQVLADTAANQEQRTSH